MLFADKDEWHCALEPITVYKIVLHRYDGILIDQYSLYRYIIGKEHSVPYEEIYGSIFKEPDGSCHVYGGFKSYGSQQWTTDRVDLLNFYHAEQLSVAECTIPKDTLYIKNGNEEYTSDRIIINGLIYPYSWSRK